MLLKVKGSWNGQNGKFAWSGAAYFPQGISACAIIDKIRYALSLWTTEGKLRKWMKCRPSGNSMRERFYLHDGVQYQVTQLDPETHTVLAAPFQGNFIPCRSLLLEIRILHSVRGIGI